MICPASAARIAGGPLATARQMLGPAFDERVERGRQLRDEELVRAIRDELLSFAAR